MKNMVYIQSGGPTSVINSSLYGAILEAKKHPDLIDGIYGSLHGIEGLIDDDLIDLRKEDDDQIELLLQTPGSILGTTRRKLPNDIKDPVYMQIINNIKKHEIKYVFVNGGNDSMDTCNKIATLVKELNEDIIVVGVPKTIDNDLAITDHSLGFASAAKFVVNAVNAMAKDAQCFKKGKVHIFEIMGRNAGWLTASVDLCEEQNRPDIICLPEQDFNLEHFLEVVKKAYETKHYALVAISEGVNVPRDTSNIRKDSFGHAQLGGAMGASAVLASIIEAHDIPVRTVEFSLVQRAFPFLASKVDRDEAVMTGKFAVNAAINGESGKMVIFKRVSQNPYKIELQLAPVNLVANAEARVPDDMIIDDNHMSKSFKDYLRPLIQGENQLKFVDGIAPMCKFKNVKVK